MYRVLPSLTVFAAVVTTGIVPGVWENRWASSASLDEAAARLATVPLTIGAWDGHDLEVNPREQQAAQANGFLQRRYVHQPTGAAVSLLLLCGRAGPISVHTPDVCYRGSGYEEIGLPSRCEIAGAAGDQFLVRRFQKTSALPVYLRVVYGWKGESSWNAPDNPRLAFARKPVLHKLYVIRELASPDEPIGEDPILDFLGVLLPSLGTTLASAQ